MLGRRGVYWGIMLMGSRVALAGPHAASNANLNMAFLAHVFLVAISAPFVIVLRALRSAAGDPGTLP